MNTKINKNPGRFYHHYMVQPLFRVVGNTLWIFFKNDEDFSYASIELWG